MTTKPILPTEITSTAWKINEHKLAIYETAKQWDKQVVKVLLVKFPNRLTDLEIDHGMLLLTSQAE